MKPLSLSQQNAVFATNLGNVDDGYVTSSSWLMKAYTKRPRTFRRRILFLSQNITKQELHKCEQLWLDLIKPCELGSRYYNLKTKASGGNGGANKGQQRGPEMRAKLRLANLGKKQSPELIARRIAPLLGRTRTMTDEWKAKIAKANSGKKQPQEVIAKRVISLRKAWENGAYKDRARAATKLPAL